jgi:hypothetical protein
MRPEHNPADTERGQQRAEPVDASAILRVSRLRNQGVQTDEHYQAQRDIDPKRPSPGEIRSKPATEQWSQSRGAADRGAPDAERDPSVSASEVRIEQRQRRRQHHRPSDTLYRSGQDQQAAAGGERCEHACDAKDHGAQCEHLAPPVLVGEPPADQQQGAEDQRVDFLNPLRLSRGDAKISNDRRNGHIDDRRIDDDQ